MLVLVLQKTSPQMKPQFDHEKLRVYQASLRFNGWVGDILTDISARAAVKDQLDRAATSIPLNIAEGNGKFSRRDRARYFDIARGAAVESASCLDVIVSRKLAMIERMAESKGILFEVVSMLMGLPKEFGYFGEDEMARLHEEFEAGSVQFVRESVRCSSKSKR
jgi:four helix bundle protein